VNLGGDAPAIPKSFTDILQGLEAFGRKALRPCFAQNGSARLEVGGSYMRGSTSGILASYTTICQSDVLVLLASTYERERERQDVEWLRRYAG
jgi:hypothetical protein